MRGQKGKNTMSYDSGNVALCALIAGSTLSIGSQALAVDPPFKFTDVTDAAGISPFTGIYDPLRYQFPIGLTGGVSAADYDGDGDIDIFVPNGALGTDNPGINNDISPNNSAAADGPQRPDLLYINNASAGSNTFTLVDFSTKVVAGPSAGDPNVSSRGALWLDYDGDRLLDLFVLGDCRFCGSLLVDPPPSPASVFASSIGTWFQPRLYRQRHDGTFEDVSDTAGLDQVDLLTDWLDTRVAHGSSLVNGRNLGGLCAGDLDDDGYPEVFFGFYTREGAAAVYPELRNARLLQNVADGTHRKYVETKEVLTTGFPTGHVLGGEDDGDQLGTFWQSMIVDVDDDGDLDLMANLDGVPNRMWLNRSVTTGVLQLDQQDTTLLGMPWSSDMGLATGDYDNDGDFDYFIYKANFPGSPSTQFEHDLLRNNAFSSTPTSTSGGFVAVQQAAGVFDDTNNPTWGWGATFGDINGDGWLDLMTTNGAAANQVGPSHLFMNQSASMNPSDPNDPGRIFLDELIGGGGTGSDFPDTYIGSSIVSLDYDRDGDLDLFQTVVENDLQATGLHLYSNDWLEGTPNTNLIIQPRSDEPNSHAIGTKITVIVDRPGSANDLVLIRSIAAGTSQLGQEAFEAHFGLGEILPTTLIGVVVEWLGSGQPDTTITMNGAQVLALDDSVLRIGWCSFADLAEPYGVLDSLDYSEFIALYSAHDPRADFAAPFGSFDFFDISAFNSKIAAGCTY